MKIRHVCKWCLVAALAALGANLGLQKAIGAEPGPADAQAGVQVLTRGPVHEAFAETVTFDPEPGIVAPKTPPAAIEELPPGQKPEGVNVAWIPGYWGWDDERKDFLWVSGIWRDLPPGRQWVPGYWGESAQGSQWTSGYWADAKASEAEYLPEPPATVEAGPNIAAPSANETWLPGSWVWHQSRYAWRPGFWAAAQPNWVWIPAHYVWSRHGYVFVDGYWDYSVGRRGVLFAPVYFNAGVYARRGFSYSPMVVINSAVFANHLFLRPRYQHYYFGDYYDANYLSAGYYPSYSYNSRRYGYDPIYAYDRWHHRLDSTWERQRAADFAHRRDHENVRPPRVWAAQRAIDASAVQSRERGIVMAAPLGDLVKSKDSPLRFQPVDQSERQKLAVHAQQVQRFREQRQTLETSAAAASAASPPKSGAAAKLALPGSPIAAKPVADLGKDHAPPKVYEAPKPDPKVASRARVARSGEQPKERTVNRLPLDEPQAKPEPRPKAERPAPKPKPKAERETPQPKPKAERDEDAPRLPPKAKRETPQPRGEAPSPPQSAEPKEKERKEKGKGK